MTNLAADGSIAKQGNIKGHRKGLAVNSPIIYSRLELMALKQAEERLLTINLKTR